MLVTYTKTEILEAINEARTGKNPKQDLQNLPAASNNPNSHSAKDFDNKEFVNQHSHPKVGLVMTMGALHDGHRELLRKCRSVCDLLVASIYVNPLQFGPGEDFDAYPRPIANDLEIIKAERVDIAFVPSDKEMYPHWPKHPLVIINPGQVAILYEGQQRPTHFAGVLQIVNKVFNLVNPDVSCFGQKDAQQLALIKTMIRDLDMNIQIISVPVQRDHDGLALSSRNAYLSTTERQKALSLYKSLQAGELVAKQGGDPTEIRARVRQVIASANITPDYVILVDPTTYERIDDCYRKESQEAVLAIAARVGNTRLLDNITITIGAK